MGLTNVQKRVGRLENALADLSPISREHEGHHELPTLIHQLLDMAMEASRSKRALLVETTPMPSPPYARFAESRNLSHGYEGS